MKTFSEFLTEALNESTSSNATDTYYKFIDKYDMDEAGIGSAYRDFDVFTFDDVNRVAKKLRINITANDMYQGIKVLGMCFAKYLENNNVGEVKMDYSKTRGFKITVNGKKYVTIKLPSDVKEWLSDMESGEEVEGSWDPESEFPAEVA